MQTLGMRPVKEDDKLPYGAKSHEGPCAAAVSLLVVAPPGLTQLGEKEAQTLIQGPKIAFGNCLGEGPL